jgi:LacI family transcriptional regulator
MSADQSGAAPSSLAPRQRARSSQATLEDVANHAGVSTASVSRMVKDPSAVSAKLRARIEAAINELSWVPHAAARALATQSTRTIGAVFPTLANEHFSTATQVIQEELEKLDYTLLLACSEYDAEREFRQARKMIERGVDAMVLVGDAHHPELYPLLRARGIPFVSTFTYRSGDDPICIGSDNYRMFHQATKYLLSLGHRSFAMLAQSTVMNDRAAARRQGVFAALAEEGFTIRPSHIAEGFAGVHQGRELFRQVAEANPRPTAVICGNGSFAMGAVLEAQTMGIGIPSEMTIFGFDDFELMKELPVAISTIRVPSREIGRKAAHYLVNELNPNLKTIEWDGNAECEAEIVLRDSSAPPLPAG